MPTFKYAKLVRDDIPGWHRANGHTVHGRKLTAGEYIESVTIPDENDKWAQYCRRDPSRYPEIAA